MSAAAGSSAWPDAALAAAVMAVDPAGTGVALRALPGPARDAWLALVRALVPPGTPVRRLPAGAGDDRLLGGLDLAATLRAGRPVVERGLLAEADRGLVLLAMAERLPPAIAGRLVAALDAGEVRLERDGLALRLEARFGLVALDEGVGEDERLAAALADRLACQLDLAAVATRDIAPGGHEAAQVAAARVLLPTVAAGDEVVTALCATAAALGVASVRASVLALRVARVAAALAGRRAVAEDDAIVAGRLVLAPRATTLPHRTELAEGSEEPPPAERPDEADPSDTGRPLEERVLSATRAAIPGGLLASLTFARSAPRAAASGKAGAIHHGRSRGRPAGVRRGVPRAGARLNVIETLRAAAPWQRLRGAELDALPGAARRLEVRPQDLRLTRFKERSPTTTIFCVDASGSAAFHRLAEAKGAVELLLADCYVRRDQVALLAFRGRGAELLLPPTRSLARAKRSLAGLPGGGGTPLAAGIDAGTALADGIRRRGATPILVLLTDGRANVTRAGLGGRRVAEEEALAAARALRAQGVTALVVDTAPQPQPAARRRAATMSARYLPLPRADAAALSEAIRVAPAAARLEAGRR